MAQISDPADLPTDAYPTTIPTASAAPAPNPVQNKKKATGIAAAALLLGGSAWAIKQDRPIPSVDNSDQITADPEEPTIVLPRELDVAGKITDAMSFDEAFAAAREEVGMAGVFGWHGRWYNTFLKEEWSELSIRQRMDFTEMVTHEKLPVKSYDHTDKNAPRVTHPLVEPEPTLIEGHINGHRVMGLDFDQDGVIDTLVMDAEDGYTYRVVDATGDQGLDTIYKYDALDGDWVMVEKIDHPFVLSNDDFNQNLEETMSRDVVNSILDADDSAPANPEPMPVSSESVDTEPDDDTIYLTDVQGADDDTYNNHGDVREMDEQ